MKETDSGAVHSQLNEELMKKPCPVWNSGAGTKFVLIIPLSN